MAENKERRSQKFKKQVTTLNYDPYNRLKTSESYSLSSTPVRTLSSRAEKDELSSKESKTLKRKISGLAKNLRESKLNMSLRSQNSTKDKMIDTTVEESKAFKKDRLKKSVKFDIKEYHS